MSNRTRRARKIDETAPETAMTAEAPEQLIAEVETEGLSPEQIRLNDEAGEPGRTTEEMAAYDPGIEPPPSEVEQVTEGTKALTAEEQAAASAEKILASQKRWREKNKDKVRAYQKRWRQNNPDKVRESHKKYQKKNPDKVKAWHKASQDRGKALREAGREAIRQQELAQAEMAKAQETAAPVE